MIDFHTHILPNIDNGSQSIEETFKLLEEAKKAGFKGVIFTSHYKEGYYETETAEREVWMKAITTNLKIKETNMDLYLASEIYISDNIMNLLEEAKASTINNSCYVLFEMPRDNEPDNLYNVIYNLQKNKLIPVLAHPERYHFVQKEPNLIYDLIQSGCLMQANYGSVIGMHGKKAQILVKKFLENGYIHFLGSDVHRKNSIYPQIPEILKIIEEIVGTEKLEQLTNVNPKLALANKKITIEEPNQVELDLKEKIKMFLSFRK